MHQMQLQQRRCVNPSLLVRRLIALRLRQSGGRRTRGPCAKANRSGVGGQRRCAVVVRRRRRWRGVRWGWQAAIDGRVSGLSRVYCAGETARSWRLRAERRAQTPPLSSLYQALSAQVTLSRQSCAVLSTGTRVLFSGVITGTMCTRILLSTRIIGDDARDWNDNRVLAYGGIF
jgi:hypothetical protein